VNIAIIDYSAGGGAAASIPYDVVLRQLPTATVVATAAAVSSFPSKSERVGERGERAREAVLAADK